MNRILGLNFLVALIGALASLYFSEVMGLPPCNLCWYQRTLFYPIVFVLATAIWTNDRKYQKYVLPMASVGLAISFYHNLLYYGIVSSALIPCTKEVSCSSRQLELLGFITIPLLSFVGFLTMTVLVLADSTKNHEGINEK
jgi:disulfide bond formation protein DsbB